MTWQRRQVTYLPSIGRRGNSSSTLDTKSRRVVQLSYARGTVRVGALVRRNTEVAHVRFARCIASVLRRDGPLGGGASTLRKIPFIDLRHLDLLDFFAI